MIDEDRGIVLYEPGCNTCSGTRLCGSGSFTTAIKLQNQEGLAFAVRVLRTSRHFVGTRGDDTEEVCRSDRCNIQDGISRQNAVGHEQPASCPALAGRTSEPGSRVGRGTRCRGGQPLLLRGDPGGRKVVSMSEHQWFVWERPAQGNKMHMLG